jgi:hypothetical protein
MVGLFHLVSNLFWADVNDYAFYDGTDSAKIRTITYVFASLAFAPLAICFLVYGGYVSIFFGWKGLIWAWNYARWFSYYDNCFGHSDKRRKRVHIDWSPPYLLEHSVRNSVLAILFFGLAAAFYCDWILAAIAENWAGLPSNDIAVLFWFYFVAKRLPMLSF